MQALSREAQRAAEQHLDSERRVVDDSLTDLYRLLEDGIVGLGGWPEADRLIGMNHNDIRKIVQRKAPDRRGLAIDDVLPIARAIMHKNPAIATRIGAALVDALGLQVFPRVSVPDALRLDRLSTFVRTMPLGKQLLAEALDGLAAADDKARADAVEALLRKLCVGSETIEDVINGVRR